MKRIVAFTVAVLLTALVAVNASAQDGGKVSKAKKLEAEKIKGELFKEAPIPYDTSTHTAWASGELQKEIGSKNKDKKKIVMYVWCEYGHDSPSTYWWQVKYSLRAENKDTVGSGWHEVGDLYALTYNLAYKIGGGSPTTKSGNIGLSGKSRVDWEVIVSGDHAPAVPTFTTNSFTGKRGGGSSGIDLDWP
ncbi:MAG TPA: hypothetical protein VF736_08065 [Pyrinomonadaceae bacterium]|jgi:hypothetical protein